MKISDTLRIVEIAWLVVITICVFEIVRAIATDSGTNISIYIVVGIGATIMFFLRRTQRKRYLRRDNNAHHQK
ncbi:hypothetical protein [Thermaurantimonas aggregans]|uniref:hypothetical protein n=1 Tax=Thermaurantimonas aggregans TaxID=2173829 RepID=UPI000F55CB0C|nr:hypothetical protein [Thermaurantimonas aggregans]MCX8147831.1 hypothetical protein [Thermaurantimonas aggregans]